MSEAMELEGLGVSCVGRPIWSYHPHDSDRWGSGIPWEYIQSTNYTARYLIRGSGESRRLCEAEGSWNCVWTPTSSRDWSGLATLIRSIGVGSCLLVFDTVEGVPNTFWTFLDTIVREGKILVTRIWLHTIAPQWIPDVIFFPPLDIQHQDHAFHIIQALPARGGHGIWNLGSMNWASVVQATREQGLGLAITDIEETAWTLLWHRVADSRPTLHVERASNWIETGTLLLQTHAQASIFEHPNKE